jgi:DNA-directed RNA polymerase specialized sigma24 family protein
MSESKDYIQLVRRAQQGHPEARGDLLRIVEPRLAEYVGRLTLDRDLTTDIVQESITEMLKIFTTLKDPERFWCWLYTITLNKVRGHYRRRWRRRETSLSDVHEQWLQAKNQDALAELVTQELKEIVLRSVGQLDAATGGLTMRCYDQMSYEQISAALLLVAGARALFYRQEDFSASAAALGSTRAPCRWPCWSSANSAPRAKRPPRGFRSRPRRCVSGSGGYWRVRRLHL